MRKKISQLLEEMQFIIFKSGIKEDKYAKFVNSISLVEDNELESIHVELMKVKNTEWKMAHHVWHLPANEELWETYKKLNINGLPEQKLFQEASKNLKIALNRIYKNVKEIITKQKKSSRNPDAVSIRSQRTGTNASNNSTE